MITDEMLSAAAGEVGTCILDSLPPVVEHDFSRNFRRKTKRLIFKTDHPTMHILRNCAAVLLVLLTAFASLIAISPTVRAAVVQWVKGIYKGGTAYSYEGQAPKTCSQYVLTHIPDGYVLDDIWKHDDGVNSYARWSINWTTTGYVFKNNARSGYALCTSSSTADGAYIDLASYANGTVFRWTLENNTATISNQLRLYDTVPVKSLQFLPDL